MEHRLKCRFGEMIRSWHTVITARCASSLAMKNRFEKGHFIVQGVSGVKTVLDKEQPKFQIEGETLSYQACYTEGFALEGDLGAYLILVLPDEYAEKLDIYEAVYVADTEKKSAPEDYENLCRIIEPLEDGEEMDGEDYIPVGNVNVKGAVLGENRTMFTIISFSMFYIALIFAVQHLPCWQFNN